MPKQPADIKPILNKVKKLLALSSSSNPHEAATAAAKAQELLAQYNLELSQVETQEQATCYEQTTLETGSRVWRRQLLHIIAHHNFCQTLYNSAQKRVVLIGERHNSEIVEFLYTSLAAQLETMARDAYRRSQSHIPALTWKDSFFAGALSSLNVRLREQQDTFAATSSQCRALVVLKSEELEKAVRQMYPNVGTSRAKRVIDCDGYAQGVKAGKTVALHKAIAH